MGRRKRLEQIRRMLGAPESQPDEAVDEDQERDASADLAGDEETAKGYPCPVCGQGRMVRGATMPRPRVWQILTMPFPDEHVIAKCRRRLTLRQEEANWIAASWALIACPEIRRRLLPFVFT